MDNQQNASGLPGWGEPEGQRAANSSKLGSQFGEMVAGFGTRLDDNASPQLPCGGRGQSEDPDDDATKSDDSSVAPALTTTTTTTAMQPPPQAPTLPARYPARNITAEYPSMFYIPPGRGDGQAAKDKTVEKQQGTIHEGADLLWQRGFFGWHPFMLSQETLSRIGGITRSGLSRREERAIWDFMADEAEYNQYRSEHKNKGSRKNRIGTLDAPTDWKPPNTLFDSAASVTKHWTDNDAQQHLNALNKAAERYGHVSRSQVVIGVPPSGRDGDLATPTQLQRAPGRDLFSKPRTGRAPNGSRRKNASKEERPKKPTPKRVRTDAKDDEELAEESPTKSRKLDQPKMPPRMPFPKTPRSKQQQEAPILPLGLSGTPQSVESEDYDPFSSPLDYRFTTQAERTMAAPTHPPVLPSYDQLRSRYAGPLYPPITPILPHDLPGQNPSRSPYGQGFLSRTMEQSQEQAEFPFESATRANSMAIARSAGNTDLAASFPPTANRYPTGRTYATTNEHLANTTTAANTNRLPNPDLMANSDPTTNIEPTANTNPTAMALMTPDLEAAAMAQVITDNANGSSNPNASLESVNFLSEVLMRHWAHVQGNLPEGFVPSGLQDWISHAQAENTFDTSFFDEMIDPSLFRDDDDAGANDAPANAPGNDGNGNGHQDGNGNGYGDGNGNGYGWI